jgi:2-C-methyl-D-erythritol 4-phosphate cytidylyltransferase/2-C-methyl-D-erythritol 2,4-cyclodiphosphate synthase
MSVAVLISAAGRGTRINTPDLPKQYLSLCGVSVLRHTINAFINHPKVDHILVVIHPDDIELYKEAVIGLDLLPPVFGGARRQDSVRLGLDALKEFSPTKVLIHDAARPFISKQIISTVINQLDIAAAAIPAIPLDDTIKKCADGKTLWTVDRTDLWRVQTPQGFLFSEIIDQHHLYQDKNFTDDASVSEYAGIAAN